MGRGDPQNKGAARRAQFRPQAEFVRYDLTEAEKAKVKGTEFDEIALVETIEKLTQAGYKMTFRWDDYNECQGCWLLAPENDENNKGLILTGRGSTSLKAFKQAAWLHFTRFKEIWPQPTSKRELELDD